MDALKTALIFLLAPAVFAGPVDVNSADAETIAAELDGVGIARARAIVEYRSQNGAFESTEDLMNVNGVGQRLIELNREHIRLSTPGGDN